MLLAFDISYILLDVLSNYGDSENSRCSCRLLIFEGIINDNLYY